MQNPVMPNPIVRNHQRPVWLKAIRFLLPLLVMVVVFLTADRSFGLPHLQRRPRQQRSLVASPGERFFLQHPVS